MDAPDPVVANADLWSAYLYQQWRPLLELFGGRQTAAALGAGIAELHAGAVGPRIDEMYSDNARDSSPASSASSAPERQIADAVSSPPEWLCAVIDAEERASALPVAPTWEQSTPS